jgi:hypothetical protein
MQIEAGRELAMTAYEPTRTEKDGKIEIKK